MASGNKIGRLGRDKRPIQQVDSASPYFSAMAHLLLKGPASISTILTVIGYSTEQRSISNKLS